MTESRKSPKSKTGFPGSLENAHNAFPTFPQPRLLLLNFSSKSKLRKDLPLPSHSTPSGSSLD